MYVVSLKQLDGPLDLLLSLVQHAKIDIQDIFVSQITEQYLESMAGVDELDMDSASEFLAMAATLMEIKSRALLPAPPEPEEEGEESPEQALIRQLTEYKAFKETCEDMKRLEQAASLMLSKLPQEYPLPPPEYELTGLTLEGLMNPDGTVSDVQTAFMEETSIQCGFCIPGFILTATEIVNSGKEYTDDELRKLLSGHLCRCTGYQNIFRAVKKTMLRRLGKNEEAELVR